MNTDKLPTIREVSSIAIDNDYVKHVATIKNIPIKIEKDALEVMIKLGSWIEKPRTQPSHMAYWAGSGNVDMTRS